MLLRQQAVNAGHADVGDQLDRVAHQPRGHHGLFGYRQVTGARADHGNRSLAGNGLSLRERDGSGRLMKLRVRFDG